MDASQAQKSKREHLARHRNRQGRTRRRPLTEVELRYCAMRARGVTIRQAALELGLNEGTVLQWSTRRPAIKEQIEEYKARSKEEAYKETQKEITLRNEFLDEQVIRRLQEKATTPDIVRLSIWATSALAPFAPRWQGSAQPFLNPQTLPHPLGATTSRFTNRSG